MENFNRKNEPVDIRSLFEILAEETRECQQHGEYQSTLLKLPVGERWSDCPACFKQQIRTEDAQIAAESEKARQRALVESTLNRSAIPKRFLDKTLGNYRAENDGQKKALATVSRYVAEWPDNKKRGRCLIMCGNPGTGKTHLAVGIAAALIEKNETVLFARLIEMARAIKETYRTESYSKDNGLPQQRKLTEREVLDGFSAPDLLIIDEVGRQHGTDFERMMLFEVIQGRYEQCKPTILVTNLPAKSYDDPKTQTRVTGLDEYLDEAAKDRLREGGGKAIIFDWQSERGFL